MRMRPTKLPNVRPPNNDFTKGTLRPTPLDAMYPGMLEAMQEAKLNRRVTFIVRLVTATLAITVAAGSYYIYVRVFGHVVL